MVYPESGWSVSGMLDGAISLSKGVICMKSLPRIASMFMDSWEWMAI